MKKKIQEKLAAREGFTLIELIVVIAILAILAAVAVPTYTSYISKANDASDYEELSSIKTAVVAALAEDHSTDEVTEITVIEGSVTYNSGTSIDISEFYDIENFTFNNENTTSATWEGGEWTLS